MKPQDEYNPNIQYVLQKIKRQNPHTQTELRYDISLLTDNNNELEILRKLVDWQAIQIKYRKLKQNLCVSVYLKILQPKFNYICDKNNLQSDGYDKLHSPQNYIELEIERFELVLKHLKIAKAYLDYGLYYKRRNKHAQKKFYRPKNKKHKASKQLHLFTKENPFPIAGEIVVPGLTESLNALKPKSPEHTGPKFPYKIPAGTHWNNVIIKFLNDERIEIWVKRLNHVTDYKEMGMVGKGKIPTPSEQWIFLKVLAQCRGELTIRDSDAKDTYKKQKQALAETLQQYFSIDYDPFYPYKTSPEKRGNSYKIKIILLPPPETGKDILHREEINHDPLGISEFLSEKAPQVPDF